MRLLGGLIILSAFAIAADKGPAVSKAGNGQLQVTATLFAGRAAIQRELGSDLGEGFTVVKVDLVPQAGKALLVSRDDFLLRSYKDGQKSEAYAPSQIAGRGTLVVTTRVTGGGGTSERRGPVWGGMPGTGGQPSRLPSNQPPVMGNAAGQTSADASADNGEKDKDNPLLALLKEKVLPEKETKEPLSGYLYFSLEGKHKPKDIVLQYKGPAGKLSFAFRPQK
jgi:hypothetical protein